MTNSDNNNSLEAEFPSEKEYKEYSYCVYGEEIERAMFYSDENALIYRDALYDSTIAYWTEVMKIDPMSDTVTNFDLECIRLKDGKPDELISDDRSIKWGLA